MLPAHIPTELIEVAERILSSSMGTNIHLDHGKMLQDGIRARIYRFSITDRTDDEVKHVIVKQAKSTAKAPYNPERATIPAWTFFNEWASLQFLTALCPEDPPAPRFYGGDRSAGVMVMEDMATEQCTRLDQILLGNNPAEAEAALIAYATEHGRLHAFTSGKEHIYKQFREPLGPGTWEDEDQSYAWLAPTFYQAADLLGVTPERGVEQDLETLKQSLLHPGPFLSFIQSDACPDNVLFYGSTMRLLDFEGGTFDHVLKEGVYGRMLFPSCWCVYQIPISLAQRMEQVYRSELAKGCPAAQNDRLFNRAIAEMCVYWMIRWYQMAPLTHVWEKDRLFRAATDRQRHLLRTSITARTTEEMGHLQAIGATMHAMAAKMRACWPDTEEMPMFPAFTVQP